jgi:hypothetical protein
MSARAYPVDAVGALPSYSGRALRQTAVAPFVAMGSASRTLGGVSGVRPGTPASIGSVTSTQWSVNPFAGVIDGESLAIAGPYTYAFDTAQTGAVNTAGSSARTDRLDVQINDSAESDGTPATTPAFAQIVYTPSAGAGVPAAPARTHPLFLINVPASGGGSPTLTWNASFTAAPGGHVEFLTLAALYAWTPADPAQLATVTSDPTVANNGDYRWTGTAWVATRLNIGASVKRSGTAATFSAGAWTQLTNAAYWVTDQPAAGMTAFNGTFVAPVAGLYDVRAGIQLDTAVSAILALKKNDGGGSALGTIAQGGATGFANDTSIQTSKLVRLNAGDYVAAAIYCSAAATWNTNYPDSSYFAIRYVEPLR